MNKKQIATKFVNSYTYKPSKDALKKFDNMLKSLEKMGMSMEDRRTFLRNFPTLSINLKRDIGGGVRGFYDSIGNQITIKHSSNNDRAVVDHESIHFLSRITEQASKKKIQSNSYLGEDLPFSSVMGSGFAQYYMASNVSPKDVGYTEMVEDLFAQMQKQYYEILKQEYSIIMQTRRVMNPIRYYQGKNPLIDADATEEDIAAFENILQSLTINKAIRQSLGQVSIIEESLGLSSRRGEKHRDIELLKKLATHMAMLTFDEFVYENDITEAYIDYRVQSFGLKLINEGFTELFAEKVQTDNYKTAHFTTAYPVEVALAKFFYLMCGEKLLKCYFEGDISGFTKALGKNKTDIENYEKQLATISEKLYSGLIANEEISNLIEEMCKHFSEFLYNSLKKNAENFSSIDKFGVLMQAYMQFAKVAPAGFCSDEESYLKVVHSIIFSFSSLIVKIKNSFEEKIIVPDKKMIDMLTKKFININLNNHMITTKNSVVLDLASMIKQSKKDYFKFDDELSENGAYLRKKGFSALPKSKSKDTDIELCEIDSLDLSKDDFRRVDQLFGDTWQDIRVEMQTIEPPREKKLVKRDLSK